MQDYYLNSDTIKNDFYSLAVRLLFYIMKYAFLLTLLIQPILYAQELYSLEDVNPNSITYESVIGPDYFGGKVVLHYFGAFT